MARKQISWTHFVVALLLTFMALAIGGRGKLFEIWALRSALIAIACLVCDNSSDSPSFAFLLAPDEVTADQAREVADEIRDAVRGGLRVRLHWHGRRGIRIEGRHEQIDAALNIVRDHQILWEIESRS